MSFARTLFTCLLVAGCTGGGQQAAVATSKSTAVTPAAPTKGEHKLVGGHFDVVWSDTAAADDDAKRVLERGEQARTKLVDILGKERAGDRHIRIRLAGEGSARAIPSVDPDSGDIVLYRFSGASGAYEAPLAHELVHAIRLSIWTNPERQTDPALFWEEGFAELLAREAGFPSTGFPLYGIDPDIGAATFVTRGEALPIEKLLAEHRALNFRCMAQAYVERISFMTHVRRRVGLAPMIAVAYVDAPLDIPLIEKTLGMKVADLAAAHAKEIGLTAARPDAREAGTKFRETTPIRYLPLCRGAD